MLEDKCEADAKNNVASNADKIKKEDEKDGNKNNDGNWITYKSTIIFFCLLILFMVDVNELESKDNDDVILSENKVEKDVEGQLSTKMASDQKPEKVKLEYKIKMLI